MNKVARLAANGWIFPHWPAPVSTAVSTRNIDGASMPPFDNFNIGSRCGDDARHVAANRVALVGELDLRQPPRWLHQVHGRDVVRLSSRSPHFDHLADAAVSSDVGVVLAILTADCLPVLFASRDGCHIGAAHAGWRGLAAGVLEATVDAMHIPAAEITAWLGPAIAADSYEVGEEVRAAFVGHDSAAATGFSQSRPGHWLCDLTALAIQRLRACGVEHIHGGGFDTFNDARFYSFRRASPTGRFASLIWRHS
ncbi:MAG: peptidoglycan editing factor PgeF [Dokdonella sp.]